MTPQRSLNTRTHRLESCVSAHTVATSPTKENEQDLDLLFFDEHLAFLWVTKVLEAFVQDSLCDAARQIVNAQYLALVLKAQRVYVYKLSVIKHEWEDNQN